MENEMIAWCAGFLDGEGSFLPWVWHREGRPPTFQCKITANQVSHREPLDRLAQYLGGKVSLQPRYTGDRPLYEWSVTGGAQCKAALELIAPYISNKREVCALLYEYLETFVGRSGVRLSDEIVAERIRLIEAMKVARRS